MMTCLWLLLNPAGYSYPVSSPCSGTSSLHQLFCHPSGPTMSSGSLHQAYLLNLVPPLPSFCTTPTPRICTTLWLCILLLLVPPDWGCVCALHVLYGMLQYPSRDIGLGLVLAKIRIGQMGA